jgi:hypothetical protein
MGSSASLSSPQKYLKENGVEEEKEESIREESINAELLFSALLKLACTFEIKDNLTISLISEISDPKHIKFNEQFVAVEKWIQKNSDAQMSASEIHCLIKYVKLYEPSPEDTHASNPLGWHIIDDSSSIRTMADDVSKRCRLMCPYRSEVESWTAEIRREEAKKSSERVEMTDRIITLVSTWSHDGEDGDTSAEQEGRRQGLERERELEMELQSYDEDKERSSREKSFRNWMPPP